MLGGRRKTTRRRGGTVCVRVGSVVRRVELEARKERTSLRVARNVGKIRLTTGSRRNESRRSEEDVLRRVVGGSRVF